ncbi:MAG TPA: hypothetical protein VIG62_05285 [Blastocatellia bacterium]|jgi:hypothetical protein
MPGHNKNKKGNQSELAKLMRAAVETRSRLERARERLRSIENKLNAATGKNYERQHEQALGEYIAAASKAKEARTKLLKQLRERAV